ncbi:sugar phosphate isomerase/epimerase family protein (plasmid) [Sinorhizobium meliloti]
MAAGVELLISYFAISGDVHPFGPTEISPFPFKDRVEAAARAGFVGFGLHPDDVAATRDQMGYAEMRRIIEANGMKYLEIEAVVDWYKAGDERAKADLLRAQIFEAVNELGMRDIKALPGFEGGEPNIELMGEEFGKLCDQAAATGTEVVLEIMPWSNVRTIEAGVGIMEVANRNNGGLLLDIWHMARGNIPYSDISKIPAHFIKAIEIDDALREPPVENIWDDTIHHRMLPGEGELDVPAFLRAVKAAGYDGVYGTEVLSADHRKRGLDEMARRVFESSMAQFAEV